MNPELIFNMTAKDWRFAQVPGSEEAAQSLNKALVLLLKTAIKTIQEHSFKPGTAATKVKYAAYEVLGCLGPKMHDPDETKREITNTINIVLGTCISSDSFLSLPTLSGGRFKP